MKKITCLFLLFSTTIFSQITSVSLEDIWQDYKFYPTKVTDFHWVGNHTFAQLENNNSLSPSIIAYSITSGDRTSVLLESQKYENFISNAIRGNAKKQQIEGKELKDYLISDFELSKDNNKILLQLGSEDLYRYSKKSNLLIYEVDNSVFTFIPTTEKVFYPQFSPDGNFISYIESNNIYVYDIRNKRIKQLTTDGDKNKVINGMSDWVYEEEFLLTQAYEWSKDSKTIAFLRFDESKVKIYDIQFWGNQLYPINYSYKYPKAGGDNSKLKVCSIGINDLEMKVLKDYSEEDIYIPRIYWVNNKVTVLKMNRLQNEYELIQFHPKKKKHESILYREKAKKYVELKDHLFFGNNGFVISNEVSGFRYLYYYNYDGKLIKQLTEGSWEVDKVFGLVDGEVYFSSTEKNIFERNIYKVDLSGQKKVIVNFKGENKLQISPTGSYLINHNSSFFIADNFKVLDSEGALIRDVETNKVINERISELELPQPEYFTFENTEGDTLNGYFIKPIDFDVTKKYPVLVYVYGGPGYQVLKDVYDGFNYFWYTHLTEQGFIVALVDVRGTGGRGRAFRECTYGKLGELESNDITQITKHIKLMPFTDEQKFGIWGWSYGGYLSSLVATKSDVFNAVIAVAPVTNWRFYDTIYSERYLGLPDGNAEGYDGNSPLNSPDGLTASYLLIHGTGDDNVQVQNTMFMQNALIGAGKQFDVFYYPDRNHGIYGRNTRLHLYKMMTNFLLEKLK